MLPAQSRRRALSFGLFSLILPTATSLPVGSNRKAPRPNNNAICKSQSLLTPSRRNPSSHYHRKRRRDGCNSSRNVGTICRLISDNDFRHDAVVPTAIAMRTPGSALDSFRKGSNDTENGLRDRDRGVRRPGDVLRGVVAAATSRVRSERRKLTARDPGTGHHPTDDREDPLDRVRLLRHLPLRLACLVLGTYLSVGVVAYKRVFREPSWSVLDALYFSSACLSTIGYGDLVPSTTGGKLFAAFFGVSGILVWSSAVATVGARLVQSETARLSSSAPTRTRRARRDDKRAQWMLLARSLAKPLLLIVSGGTVIGRLEGWSLCDSVYFSLVTATTIGFGDFCPTTEAGKLATVLLVPVLLAAAGDVFASLGLFAFRSRTRELFAGSRERAEWLTPEQAKTMDLNRDGRVSKPEFVLYMLTETGCVSRDDLGPLEEQFERFDVTRSGYIEEGDLETMRAIRDTTPPRKTGPNPRGAGGPIGDADASSSAGTPQRRHEPEGDPETDDTT